MTLTSFLSFAMVCFYTQLFRMDSSGLEIFIWKLIHPFLQIPLLELNEDKVWHVMRVVRKPRTVRFLCKGLLDQVLFNILNPTLAFASPMTVYSWFSVDS